ncbi:TMEM165/GDT1 family protein [Gelria sp. Kuro-4]|jgi:putative Ca2+/H+ antiporter (TMEM165/GDT1 family)|uniref:TMEM165/GDT1 family protein n=1 Tax=Gelria sp. Kuro-4 TaxID=2796927 RepID=UPI001BEEB3C9|nr:TMEM165/GDT1 family protein [Gelria sp. Kuro-4]BCV25614.1 UPF0016 family membrane protein [Gelria sp. Kuro-4]
MNWKLFGVAFSLLFLAELGDKTQLAVFTLATQHHAPWPIFFGASAALVLVTFLGAFFGSLITRYVPAQYVQLAAGLLFIIMGVGVLWQAAPAVRHVFGLLK